MDKAPEPSRSRWFPEDLRKGLVWGKPFLPTMKYWLETEVHVYSFAIGAYTLLAFFPFLIVIVSFCRYILEWRTAEAMIYVALQDFFPGEMGDFIQRNLRATVQSRGPVQVGSLILLLLAGNGVFMPLEVAFNRVWGVMENRSYFKNQAISFGLVFLCGGLALVSTILTGFNQDLWTSIYGQENALRTVVGVLAFKIAALPISILALFLVYWLLPNCRVPWVKILPVAIYVGILLELLKNLNLLLWPFLRSRLRAEYGPFLYSASIVLLTSLAAMIVLAGGEWIARSRRAESQGREDEGIPLAGFLGWIPGLRRTEPGDDAEKRETPPAKPTI